MTIDDYDEDGRTALMNAAIRGDFEETQRLLALGANPELTDGAWHTSTAIDYASRQAKVSDVHRKIIDVLATASSALGSYLPFDIPNDSRSDVSVAPSHGTTETTWPQEIIRTRSGTDVVRIRSFVFYRGAVVSIFGGIALYLYGHHTIGGALILTVAPCLLLYPAVRYLFGGKDSIGATITTAVVEVLLKLELRKLGDRLSKRRHR